MKNIIGSIVEKENFFGREKEIKSAGKLLEDGNSLILAAPRRVGKSSFAKKLIGNVETNNWKGFYIDLEKVKTEPDFIKQFLILLKGENWWEKFHLDNFKISVSQGGIEAIFDIGKRRDVYNKIEKELPHDKDTLIVMDELTIFLNNLHCGDEKDGNCESFLNWLRGLRQVTGTKIRWIFCSSISIESFAHIHGFSYTINDIVNFQIDELQGDEPVLFIKELAKSKKLIFTDDEIQYLLNKLGWKLPFYIQLLIKEIGELADNGMVTKNIINQAYQNATSTKSTHFNTWIERLKNYGDNKPFALTILRELAKVKTSKSKANLKNLIYEKINDVDKTEEILNQLLLALENEGYIISRSGKYSFRSPFLKDFWVNRFIK